MTIYGWDASHYDAVNGDTAEKVISEGFSFYTHKAGGDKDDAELGAFWAEFKPHRDKLLLGAYWVLLPGSPIGRANAFCDRLDKVCPGWGDGPFILQVDCEEWNNDPSTVPSKAEIKAFCDRLRVRAPKLVPVVYAPKWVYGDKLKGLGYPLWASAYVTGGGAASTLYPGDSSSKWGAYSGQTPEILQYTSSAKIAGQTTSDANAYRGTLAELTALLAPGWAEDDTMTKAEFLALLNDNDVKLALCKAVLNTDNVLAAPSGAGSESQAANPFWAAGSFLQNTYNAAISARTNSAAAADPSKFVEAIKPLLEASGVNITDDQLERVFVSALKEMAAGDAPTTPVTPA